MERSGLSAVWVGIALLLGHDLPVYAGEAERRRAGTVGLRGRKRGGKIGCVQDAASRTPYACFNNANQSDDKALSLN
ncbi:hypothetical protein FIBSPDRAFT_875706 [Athelia psychrophila]|uniref:Uncharacterized protein n=1 Tax=Athelia psychrophila TaxID=1759441 RepID=A0A167XK19_9AGAM|nr:hypothetical protein FIBSPDRAFT_875706 [Fibularhizoctonia sp. CBS 109695]